MFIINLVLLLFCSACSKKPAPPPPSFPVHIAEAKDQAAPLFLEGLGHVESINSVQIRSRVEGELMNVYFTEGKEVKKNDLLFTIDPRPFEAALKNAQAQLEQSMANLILSEEKVKRYAQLTKDEYYSQIDYETLQANFAADKAIVKQNEANVAEAALELDYCWIYSPIDGLTGILQIDQGNLIAPNGNPIISINQMAPIYVTFSIPEIQLPKVKAAHQKNPLQVLVAFENFKQEIFTGNLQMFDNTVDIATGMIKLRAIFPNEDRALWPGQFVRARLILQTLSHATLIPVTAVQQTQMGPIVYVVKPDQTVEIRKVQLGQREDDWIIVLKGVEPKERIVTEGQINLYQGAKVYVPAS